MVSIEPEKQYNVWKQSYICDNRYLDLPSTDGNTA